MAAKLPEYEGRLQEETQRLGQLRLRQVDEQSVTDLRSWLVNAARQAGCQVRRIDLANPASRPWLVDDHPLENPSKQQAQEKGVSPFVLQTRAVTFSVTGSAPEVFALLKAIDSDARLMHTQSLDLRPTGRDASDLQLDLGLQYFALVRQKSAA
ncbi:hypothetical protein [Botrimarina sp.]|uniref:hypothetical protein n=1 Tax=Botrimarina sp. TaxID=2795802 RepID=UPI0032ED4F8F